mgnify:CR=1 FL=1
MSYIINTEINRFLIIIRALFREQGIQRIYPNRVFEAEKSYFRFWHFSCFLYLYKEYNIILGRQIMILN